MIKPIERFLVNSGISLAHHSALARSVIRRQISGDLDSSYTSISSAETLKFQRAFGMSLWPFFERLIMEKPEAAKKVGQFVLQWGRDIKKRVASREAGVMSPDTYVLEPTNRCNLNCFGCYASSTSQGSDMPYELIEKIDDELKDRGLTLTTLTGGEPFIAERRDRTITRLAEHSAKRKTSGFLVYTNGTMIDEETAKRMGDLQNIWPAISVEGFAESTKARRGRNIVDQIKKAKEFLDKYGVMYGFSATATSRNAGEIASDCFFEERLKDGDSFGWVFIYQPIGRGVDANLMVTGQQRFEIGKKVLEMQIGRQTPLFIGDFWNYGPLTNGCMAAGKCYFHIMADGTIAPCVFSPFGVAHLNQVKSLNSFFPETPKLYADLTDTLNRQHTMKVYREQQQKISDRTRPCILIDHPDLAREVFSADGIATSKTPIDYFNGPTADIIRQRALDWKDNWAPKLRDFTERLVSDRLATI